ncbi:dihydrofolate reductase [Carboxylicivirga sp. M1479]|uniref:dipeptidyl-peptidase 3 family protein n=1 Tax=Carboxylicivirga sp. M1479 TaxID=2594476 RepID=UPI00117871CE|nr:dihydrofolate reductase [Carboxylicivirga sp. M1479]TRX70306.1 dihydrofolate reductase [Carboxylicivirga sp. M1479]
MTPFAYQVEQFADLRILRYEIPNFETLPLNKKAYIYYLSQAALCGRDIIWDQHNEHNLFLRGCLGIIYKELDRINSSFQKLELYYKRVLFSNGLHHHYSTEKIPIDLTAKELDEWVSCFSSQEINKLGLKSSDELKTKLSSLLMDVEYATKRVCQDEGKDLVQHSANNFYKDLAQHEAEAFYSKLKDEDEPHGISHGLNSRLIKTDAGIREEVWKLNGKYSKAIEKIIYWLNKAAEVAENKQQKKCINLLCEYYITGDLKLFDEYSIEWLQEQTGSIDFINGFIEVYGDPLGFKATWESLVNITDEEETAKASIISEQAQWFEDHSPVMPHHRKDKVKGVTMKVINAIMLGGDCYPASPLGINLPNAEWIREVHGSKSVSLQNISHAYEMASLSSGVIEEFAYSIDEIKLHKLYGSIADNLHTHLHECVGHGSGKLEEGVGSDALKAYGSVIEEARADLFGLYFMADEKMIELGLVPHMDVAKAQYNSYIRNGLMVQLARIAEGANIEQTHMRNRQLIASWVLENTRESNAVVKVEKEGKTYFVINDYKQLRLLFGQLLKEVQRIKSQGDYLAAKKLVETYGVHVNKEIHSEVIRRYSKLNVAPYSGFLNPELTAIYTNQELIDVKVSYDESFMEQMQRYNVEYNFEMGNSRP